MKKKFDKKNKSGFSILEVVVAMAIISVGLLGVSSLVIQNFQVQAVNRDYLIASMLAQEGLELTRNLRDNNWFSAADWTNGLTTDSEFAIDYNSGPDFTVDSINDNGARLRLNSGFYSHDLGGAETPYYRLVATSLIDNALNISCQVLWQERGRTHSYTAETVLYDWY